MTTINLVKPRVSVVIPTYNSARYITSTIDSILQQTFTNFEIVIVDDCSSDETVEKIRAYKNSRIRLYTHSKNSGPAVARATGFEHAHGEYIAILDSDDLALPTRLAEQINALDKDPQLAMVGSQVAPMHENGELTGRIWSRPTSPEDAAIGLLFRNTFSSVMMLRKDAIPPHVSIFPMAEDYDFNVEVSRRHKILNLESTLTHIRIRGSGLTQTKQKLMEECVMEVMRKQLLDFGITPTPRELELNRHVGARTLATSVNLLRETESWLIKLIDANQNKQIFPEKAFLRNISCEWFGICEFASSLGIFSVLAWYRSSLNNRFWKPGAFQLCRFVARSVLRHQRKGGDLTTPEKSKSLSC